MKVLFSALILSVVCLEAGCASTIAALKDGPARPHTLRPGRFFTLTGERRLAFQVERYDPTHPPVWDPNTKRYVGRMAWCAESLPEASVAVNATSKPKVPLSANSAVGTEDAFATTLTQTFTRTEISEIYRQMGWQACQAWAQGVYSDDNYRAQLDALLATGAKVVETRASQPLPSAEGKPAAAAEAKPPAAPSHAEVAAAAKKKADEQKARAAKIAACAAAPTATCVLELTTP